MVISFALFALKNHCFPKYLLYYVNLWLWCAIVEAKGMCSDSIDVPVDVPASSIIIYWWKVFWWHNFSATVAYTRIIRHVPMWSLHSIFALKSMLFRLCHFEYVNIFNYVEPNFGSFGRAIWNFACVGSGQLEMATTIRKTNKVQN